MEGLPAGHCEPSFLAATTGSCYRPPLQVALQLAQWMAETGQAAKDEITGGRAGLPSPCGLQVALCAAAVIAPPAHPTHVRVNPALMRRPV